VVRCRVRTALAILVGSGCVTSLHVTTPASLTADAVAPDFTLPSQDGRAVSLATELARGPVVLVFYRGHW
jgi:hypothetical protein